MAGEEEEFSAAATWKQQSEIFYAEEGRMVVPSDEALGDSYRYHARLS